MNIRPLRGEIWLVDLDPTKGHEQAKTRPCLIISVNEFNLSKADLFMVLPITSKYKNLPTFVEVNSDSGLRKKSFIICDQIRTVSSTRFGKHKIGRVSKGILKKIENRLIYLLGFNNR